MLAASRSLILSSILAIWLLTMAIFRASSFLIFLMAFLAFLSLNCRRRILYSLVLGLWPERRLYGISTQNLKFFLFDFMTREISLEFSNSCENGKYSRGWCCDYLCCCDCLLDLQQSSREEERHYSV